MWDDWRKRREGNRATQKCRTVAAVRVTRSLSPTHCLTMKSGDLWHAKCQVSNVVCYISMLMTVRCVYFLPLDAVPSAVTQLSSCLADVAAWLSASRLRLNPSKTVVIWLGSKYQVDRVGFHAVPVLTSTVPIVDSARALGVILDSRLTMLACMPISVLPTSAVAPNHEVTVAWWREDTSPGIHLITPGLLQLNVIRHHRQLVSALTSRSKCHRTPYHWRAAQRPHHSDPAAASLAPGLRTSHLQARLVGFQGVARSVATVSRRWLSAASRYRAPSTPIIWRCDLFCPADSLVSWRSLFRCGWTENMEQFAYQIATTRPQPWTI